MGERAKLEEMAREVHERLDALRVALDALTGEQKSGAMLRIQAAAPSVVQLINPYYGRLAAGS